MRALVLGLSLLGASSAQAAGLTYLIGVDGRGTNPSGVYEGLANPNANRLTLLYNHGDHYHAKGVYAHVGPNLGADTAVAVGPSNYLPEGSAAPFALTAGTGVFAGLYVSGGTPDVEGSDIRFGTVDSIAGFPDGSAESILYNSSGGRWTALLAEADLEIELVGATAGLSILDALGGSIFGGGSTFSLGLGGAGLEFAPIFAAAAPGDYTASFLIRDLRADGFGESGVFEFRFTTAVPEPGGIVLSSIGGLAFAALTLWKRARGRSRFARA